MSVDLHLMIFGDSTATGYGCFSAEEVPGVLIARGLAEQTGKRIRLSTKAIVGATSRGVSGQVDAMFVAGPPPDAAVMMLGANDVTALNGISQSARRLGLDACASCAPAVRWWSSAPARISESSPPSPSRCARWHTRGVCNLPAPRPPRSRRRAVCRCRWRHLLAPQFRATPELMFSADGFHPSPTAYALAAEQLLPVLCRGAGRKGRRPHG